MTKKIDEPQELSDEDLDDANGGLILPAVQQVRVGGRPGASSGAKGLTSTEDDGQTEYRPKPVIVTSYSTGGSGAD